MKLDIKFKNICIFRKLLRIHFRSKQIFDFRSLYFLFIFCILYEPINVLFSFLRVLRPPGGGSSNLFGGEEDSASRRPNKMASNVFPSPEEPQSVTRRTNPPGGKSSGIFGDPEPPAKPQRSAPPGGPSSNIFGGGDGSSAQNQPRSHPNKPKDNLSVGPEPEPAPKPEVSQPKAKKERAPAPPVPPTVVKEVKEVQKVQSQPAADPAPPQPKEPPAAVDESMLKNHEPHLGPKPRSHNKVINPPGGKSSVVFY
uniref:Jupiter microtubule associated homolog 2 n=1 Tax=Oryzias latipes TaxID=8090 RepID=A0A3P9KUY2_ORYLA